MTKYLHENAGFSVISRVYGVFQIKYPEMDPIFFMLQRNTIQI
jgi:hypothetical protein